MRPPDYGAVIRPDWIWEVVRDRHPLDRSRVYLVTSVRAPADATPVLLLHGVGNSGAIYGPVMPLLAELGPVAAPTLSPELLHALGDRRADIVDRLVDFLAAVLPPPWHVVGHSMGGVITGLILRSRPDVVARAVLLNSPLPSVVDRIRSRDTLDRTGRALIALKALSQVTAFGRPRLPGFLRGPELVVVRNALRGFVKHPGALDDVVISRAIMSSRTTDGIDFLRLARALPDWESEPFTDRPVSILLGDDDPLVPPSDFDAVRAAYPHADVWVADECAHFAHLERPRLTVDTIAAAFDTPARRSIGAVRDGRARGAG